MAKHHVDLIFCRKQSGIGVGKLCANHDGTCVICDTQVRPAEMVRICDECNYGSTAGKCIICGYTGVADAYFCRECVLQERDRDGCPRVVNMGSARTDRYFETRRFGGWG
jgi:PHD finger-like domain-containing protein 5A